MTLIFPGLTDALSLKTSISWRYNIVDSGSIKFDAWNPQLREVKTNDILMMFNSGFLGESSACNYIGYSLL